MAKYKLLTDIEEYGFTIPKGTIVDIKPMPYGGNTTNFYYQINTQYGQTRETPFDNGSKDQPSFTIQKVSEDTPVTLEKNIKKKNIIKATFIKDYIWKSGSTCPEGYIGCAPDIIPYKKGDVLQGMLSLSKDKSKVSVFMGDFILEIPVDVLKITDDNGQIISTQEELGLLSQNNLDNTTQTFFQKHKNHLLIIGALVLGYLAYKKFKN